MQPDVDGLLDGKRFEALPIAGPERHGRRPENYSASLARRDGAAEF
jgi:hypothetical protein